MTRYAHSFLSLPPQERRLLLSALVVVAAVRLRLALLPFRAGKSFGKMRAPVNQPPSPEQITRAVDRAGRFLGNATCLARALAGQMMLARRGFSSRVSIGVTTGEPRGKDTGLIAHAWLEFGGRILLGGPDVGRYTPLFTWGS